MQKRNLKKTFALLAVVFITTATFITGCSKQETKTTKNEPDSKVQQDSPQNSSEMKTENKQDESKSENKTEQKTETSKDVNNEKDNTIQKTTIKIPTAQCGTCKKNIEKALNKVAGIKNMDVDVDNNIVKVSFDKSKTSLGKIENAITSAGYDANNKKSDPDAYSKLDDCCKLPQDRKKKQQ